MSSLNTRYRSNSKRSGSRPSEILRKSGDSEYGSYVTRTDSLYVGNLNDHQDWVHGPLIIYSFGPSNELQNLGCIGGVRLLVAAGRLIFKDAWNRFHCLSESQKDKQRDGIRCMSYSYSLYNLLGYDLLHSEKQLDSVAGRGENTQSIAEKYIDVGLKKKKPCKNE